MVYTPKDILAMGYPSGKHIPAMVKMANEEGIGNLSSLLPEPKLQLQNAPAFNSFVPKNTVDEKDNWAKVKETLEAVGKTPHVTSMAALPDACPAGPVGTIPVGGVVASKNIHPGMHSADVCCSVAISVFDDKSPKELLNKMLQVTHFGHGGRSGFDPEPWLLQLIDRNPFTKNLIEKAISHMGTQGDGNHFAFVGTLESTGQTALVTHHGSRGFGAGIYKAGLKSAVKNTRGQAECVLPQNAWIDADSQCGEDYWGALQLAREWTKQNHFALHDAAASGAKIVDRFWNEHNFVFRKSDGLFYHAKGATPAFAGWGHDATDLTLIPLNMAEPVLITRGLDNPDALGFSPHGAGRNYSRSEHARRGLGDFDSETKGLDIRSFSGKPDVSELPSAYKDAKTVCDLIERHRLAEIVDKVLPYGCIMAGELEQTWKKRNAN